MIQTAFTLAGYVYSVAVVSGLTYVATNILHLGTFSWNFVLIVSAVPALLLGIHSMDW